MQKTLQVILGRQEIKLALIKYIRESKAGSIIALVDESKVDLNVHGDNLEHTACLSFNDIAEEFKEENDKNSYKD